MMSDHFSRLVCCGHLPGCSSGEAAALAVARVLVVSVPVLDSQARQGVRELLDLIDQDAAAARDWVEDFADV